MPTKSNNFPPDKNRRRQPADQPVIGKTIRMLRQAKRFTAKKLAEHIAIDPRTLNAIETGRIRNPSMDRIALIAGALDLTLTQLIAIHENKLPGHLVEGRSSGEFVMDFGARGFKLISYTPPIPDMFCGKVILRGRKKIDRTRFSLPVIMYIQLVIGKLLIEYQDRTIALSEGKTVVLNGRFAFSICNPSQRDCTFLFFTSPAPWGQSLFDTSKIPAGLPT